MILAMVIATVGLTVRPAKAGNITINNSDFQAAVYDEDGAGGLADWYWVPDWEEGGASYYGSGSGGFLYCDSGGWVDQDLVYNWTVGEVFTLGITGNEGWRSGGSFKIQLREADTTLLWESATIPVTSSDNTFSWTIDSSSDFLGGTSGSQLNIRIECLAATVYLDNITFSTNLSDVIAPTLASANIVDNKSGGPVNPGDLITYNMLFSETMDDSTISASDFVNAGSATILVGNITFSSGNYHILVAPSSTGTLQFGVASGANLTDLAGNPLDTSSAILDGDTISVVAKSIAVTGGDFESPTVGSQVADIPEWFDNDINYSDWHQSKENAVFGTSNGTQCALLQITGGNSGYMYQSLGQLQARTISLDWSFDRVRYDPALRVSATGYAYMRFFYGVSTGVADGADIDTLGFTQIGSTITIPGDSSSDTAHSGSLDASSIPANSTIWMDLTHAGNAEFMIDNISVEAVIPIARGTIFQFN